MLAEVSRMARELVGGIGGEAESYSITISRIYGYSIRQIYIIEKPGGVPEVDELRGRLWLLKLGVSCVAGLGYLAPHLLSNKLDHFWLCTDGRCTVPYQTTEFSTYGREQSTTRFSNHCRTLPLFHRLIASKIIRGISSPFSLSTRCFGYIVAVLYIELDIGDRSQNYKDAF